MEVEVAKKKGINDIISGYSPGKVEDEKIIKKNNTWRKYRDALQRKDHHGFLKGCIDEILTPHEINGYLLTVGGSLKNCHEGNVAGVFISRLIQNSFAAGNEYFSLDNPNPELNCLGYYLIGNMHIKIKGHGGTDLARGSRGCTFTLNCSSRSVGVDAHYCTFIINENLRSVGRARNCMYKTSRKDIEKMLVRDVYRGEYVEYTDICTLFPIWDPSYNKIKFIDRDGQEEMVRHYKDSSHGIW